MTCCPPREDDPAADRRARRAPERIGPATGSAPPSEAAASGEEEELWRRSRDGDAAARECLASRFLPYARALAAKLYARRPLNDVDFEDYQQFAVVGLLEAIDRYQADRGARFTTFAMQRIRGAILSGVERATERRQQSAFRRRILAERVSSVVQDRALPDEGEAMLCELGRVGVGIALGFILEGTGMLLRPEDGLPDAAYGEVELRRIHAHVWRLAGGLGGRVGEVLELHYRGGLRFEEIARRLRLSKGRVSQLHRQGLVRVRELMAASQGCDVAF